MNDNADKQLKMLKERIGQLRLEKGISERELSLGIGKGHTYIADLGFRSGNPTYKTLVAISDYFGITLAELFDPECKNPTTTKKIDKELHRLCGENYAAIPELLSQFSEADMQHILHIAKVIAGWKK